MDSRVEQHAECVEGMMKERSQEVCGRMFRMSPETIGLSASGRYAGCEVSRAGDRQRGLAPWEAKTTVVIYCGNHV